MLVGELKRALQNLPDDMPVVYSWTRLSQESVAAEHRAVLCLLLNYELRGWTQKFGDVVLWQEVA